LLRTLAVFRVRGGRCELLIEVEVFASGQTV
jgi:hypothetical protein